MKKVLFSVLAALTMSFTAMAQIPQGYMQRIDLKNVSVMPRTSSVESPELVKTNLVSERTNHCLFDAKDGYANAFGFCIFDWRFKTNSFINFTTDNVNDYTMQVNYGQIPGETFGFFCSTFVGDKIFAYCYKYYGPMALIPVSFGFIDPKTGIYEKSFDVPSGYSTVLNNMCYDPETKLVYAYETLYDENWACTGCQIYTIDPTSETNTLKPVAKTKEELYTLACDKGDLYAVAPVKAIDNKTNKSAKLLKMPISSIKGGSIDTELIGDKSGSLKTDIGYAQAMAFDMINHKLIWFAQTGSDKSFLCEINTENGTVENRQDLNSTAQVVALAIPYQYAAATAPSYVRNLKAQAASEGEAKATLTWTNPEVDYYLNALTSLTKVNIIRDGEIVATVDATGVGQEQTYEDTSLSYGAHIYKIQPVNEAGEGVYKELRIFVGHDVPAGPSGVQIKVDESNTCHATISWNAPNAGMNGGWIDKTTLKYDVVRYPDEVKIASDITECSIEDIVEKSEGYFYAVTSKNADGVGGTTKSSVVAFGPAQTIPFFTTLASETEFNKWIVLDNNNDLTTWKFNKLDNVTCYDRAEGAADDYLVSPELTFEDGKLYQVRFKYWTINWVDPVDHSPIYDKMDIYYAQEPTAEAFKKEGAILDLGEFHTPSETYLYAKQVFTAKPGKGHIAFHAYSDPNRSIIYVQDVCVREYSATDLSITDLKGTIAAVQGTESAYGVEVMNEGSATVDKYTVDLINKETGEVLASSEGVSIDPEKKQIITINWVPAEEGEITVTSRVNLEGDTYEADNIWSKPITVTVSPSGSANWLSLNEDDSYVDEQGNFYNKGFDMPFNCASAYSMVQCIYLDKEITKKDITITGIQFIYDGLNPDNFEKDIKISAMAAEKDYFGWNSEELMVESYDYEDLNWMPLYSGKFKFGGMKNNQKLIIEFDKPYYYDGGNLVFMFEKGWDDYYFCNNDAPAFHYHDLYDDGENLRQRTCKFTSNYSDYPDPDKVGTLYWSPFTMFQYKDGDQTGIMGVTADGLSFDIFGGKLQMSQVCDSIVVYNLEGKVVAEAHNADTVALSNGIFVIKATAGKKTIDCKVTVK